MLNVLSDYGIDILTDIFVKYDVYETFSFSNLRDKYESFKRIEKNDPQNYQMLNTLAADICKFFSNESKYLGQLLTDFDNGIAFKKILQERGCEGYIFTEEPSSPTVCLLEHSKLSKPKHVYSSIIHKIN